MFLLSTFCKQEDDNVNDLYTDIDTTRHLKFVKIAKDLGFSSMDIKALDTRDTFSAKAILEKLNVLDKMDVDPVENTEESVINILKTYSFKERKLDICSKSSVKNKTNLMIFYNRIPKTGSRTLVGLVKRIFINKNYTFKRNLVQVPFTAMSFTTIYLVSCILK